MRACAEDDPRALAPQITAVPLGGPSAEIGVPSTRWWLRLGFGFIARERALGPLPNTHDIWHIAVKCQRPTALGARR